MTSGADRYRREAEQAEELARQMSRADHREECLRIARAWRELADEVARRPWTETVGMRSRRV